MKTIGNKKTEKAEKTRTMYLVTGAAGFLGGTICRQLIERGDRVRAFVLPNDKAAEYLPEEAEIAEGDLCDMESLERFFQVPQGMETIVLHIAKSTGGNVVEILKNSMEHLQSRMEVTKELQVSMSGRIFEKNIMLCMPLGVLLYLRLANPGYVDSLYRIPAGNLLMTGVIAGMILCFFWTEKIMAVEL